MTVVMCSTTNKRLWSQMSSLVLRSNRLNGSLPSSWGSLSRMRYANLASNAFTGSVPATWGNWTQVGLALHVPQLLCMLGHDFPVFVRRLSELSWQTITSLGRFHTFQRRPSLTSPLIISLGSPGMLCHVTCSSCMLPTTI